MKISKMLAGCTLTLAVAGLLSPQMVLAADPSNPNIVRPAAPVVSDVALHGSGVLVGQVVNQQGVPQTGALVRVVYQGEPVATAQADKDGRFSVTGLRGGVHTVETADSGGIYRLWAPRTAPPAAASGILLVQDGVTQRGQILSDNARRYMWGAIGGAGITGGIIAITDYNPAGS